MVPRLCLRKPFWPVLALGLILPVTSAQGQLLGRDNGLLGKLSRFHSPDPEPPLDVPDLCKRLDCLSEKLRDDGLIVIKQPDIYSQARLTHFRTDFENQMQKDLANFQLVLAARINRLDAATTTQTTNLSAALSAPGTSTVALPSAPTAPPVIPSTATGTGIDMTKGPLVNLGLANAMPNPNAPLALGVDPTVYLDEKKRFLDHLNEIRRINLGPDQNDSSGYGLYLIRMPVTITPGEKTYQGFGADVAVTVEHEFTPDFLPSTFRNLVINDVVDQLGPVIFEVIRSGLVDRFRDPRETRVELKRLRQEIVTNFINRKIKSKVVVTRKAANDEAAELQSYILRRSIAPGTAARLTDEEKETVGRRLDVLTSAMRDIAAVPNSIPEAMQRFKTIRTTGRIGPDELASVRSALQTVVLYGLYVGGPGQAFRVRDVDDVRIGQFQEFLGALYDSVLPDDVRKLDQFLGADDEEKARSQGLASGNRALLGEEMHKQLSLSLPSTRNQKQLYPIAPRELVNFFLPENILLLAKDAQQSLMTRTPRATDVRNYLRQSLDAAYNALTYRPTAESPAQPFANVDLINAIAVAALERKFDSRDTPRNLPGLFEELVDALSQVRQNFRDPTTGLPKPIAVQCWALALDAALFDNWLEKKAIPILEGAGINRQLAPGQHFYLPAESAPGVEVLAEETKLAFLEFVRVKWPMITFALDPVTDQQNVADSFNLKRDLQLALSYAFATGQINFGQLNTFRRQIEQSSDTIALNRTIIGFAHGNDTFGFRFTPRFQNPPAQRTNIGVIASQLISGGPGPDYQTRKSKLEAGMREVTAVVLIPTFLPTMRMNIATNWFRLTEPEHLVFHSVRAMERGRQVQELRQAALHACSVGRYRDQDIRVLLTKLKQLDQMLPQQSQVVQLPYENTANGWDLFEDGAKALVPELTGYDGADTLIQGVDSDVFLYGKYIHLLDTRVIVGGAYLLPSMFNIISREVVHVHIPATATPTVTTDGKTYFEVYLATPSGISNRVLVPCQAKVPPSVHGFDLAVDAENREIEVFYQWQTGSDGNPALILTDDPGAVDKKPISITWDSPTGLAPKTIQANFTATLPTGQTIAFSLPAGSGTKDDYTVDRRQIALVLLKRLRPMVSPPAAILASMTFNVTVQPYVPLESMGYRVQSHAKALKTPLTVKFIYHATDKNAVPDVSPSALNARPIDREIVRTSGQLTIPLPRRLTLPGTETPPLPPLPNLQSHESATANQALSALSESTKSSTSQPQTPLGLPPQIVVNPSPVVIVPPASPAAAKSKRRSVLRRLFDHGRE